MTYILTTLAAYYALVSIYERKIRLMGWDLIAIGAASICIGIAAYLLL
jgi:hypothetical protein